MTAQRSDRIALSDFAQAKLEELRARNLARTPVMTHRLPGGWVERNGRRLLSFSCNDYLDLAHHPRVKSAAAAALETYGAGAGASRLVSGDHPLCVRLEREIAAFKGTEAACLFGSGYLANVGLIPTVVGPGDLVLLDELAHACLWAGAQLSGATVLSFRHNDMADLSALLAAHRDAARNALIATDGVFSMDGDLAPLDSLHDLKCEHGAWLLVDDAHGLGVLGGGRGSGALFPGTEPDLLMGTLSKALGAYGAYVCGSAAVVSLLKTRARSFVYTTGLPPAAVGAAIAALDIVMTDADRIARPFARARELTRRLGLPEASSPIVPVILGSSERALAAQADLERQGFLAVAIRPPTVPAGSARLRLAFSAAHTADQVAALAAALEPWIAAADDDVADHFDTQSP